MNYIKDYSKLKLNKLQLAISLLTLTAIIYIISQIFYNNIVFSCLISILCLPYCYRKVNKHNIYKHKQLLNRQFYDMLIVIQASLNSGNNMLQAINQARDLLTVNADKNRLILDELEYLLVRYENGISIANSLDDLATRSQLKNIRDFAMIYRTAYQRSNNLEEIITKTITIMKDSFELKEEMKTLVLEKKVELYIMTVLPVFIMGFFRLLSPEYYSLLYRNPIGILIITISLFLFVLAQGIAKKILGDISDF